MDLFMQFGGGFLLGLCAAVSPGPDTVLVLRSSATGGRRAGMHAALGIGAGLAVHAVATLVLVLTLQAFADSSFLRFVQLAGALYLGYLGLSILRAAPEENPKAFSADGHCGANYFLQGFATNLTNPKAIVFFASVVSQFVAVHHVAGAAATLTGVTLAAPTWFLALSLFAAALLGRLTTAKRRLIDMTAGVLFLCLASCGVVAAFTA